MGKEEEMLKIRRFTCENMAEGCVTDNCTPSFAFSVDSDRQGAYIKKAVISVGDWSVTTVEQTGVPYGGMELKPFGTYTAKLKVWDDADETAEAELTFETGRMSEPWHAEWITDGEYHFTEKKVSPVPMTFRKKFNLDKNVKSARIYTTAIGIYELALNGSKVGDEFFAPGFTSYKSRLQYQTYDVTKALRENNELLVTVAGGWAVGSFIYTRKNRITADRQALLLEVRIQYEDGTIQIIKTDSDWDVTMRGSYRAADFYDGETYDATVRLDDIDYHKAVIEKVNIHPIISAACGAPVRAHEKMLPVSCNLTKEGFVYDFGQNFAGVVQLKLKGKRGQKVTVRHAEILKPDGTLNTAFLRTAKATAQYICDDGEQTYMPRLTYMGFRYICISGIEKENVEVAAYALYSDIERTGSFVCSSDRLNRLQENIIWSAKSNFMDIPTDCPQRDERMGWTGDIAVFAPTACYNFNMSRFLNKWLADMRAEQLKTGGIPNTVPAQGFGFPTTMPSMAIEFWGDACVMVPWAEYQAYGDKNILKSCYPMMKKYVDACRFWAGMLSVGKYRYLWNTPSVLHFGDWVAPDVPKMAQWQKRSKWTATASLKNTSGMLADIARILGHDGDAEKYGKVSENAAKAYRDILTDGNGKLLSEFQTAYVLPLYFGIFDGKERENAVENLVKLVEKNNYCIGTGFPGTPYILFALADNGRADIAYRMLFNEKCPSWLYEVKQGATTIWERWDGLDENGECPIGDDGTDMMISYNHYASGAVGDFMYRRIAGIEMTEPGYRHFRIKPVMDNRISSARGSVETPYGEIVSDWKMDSGRFTIHVHVPVGTECRLELPDGSVERLTGGSYERNL